MVVLEGSLQEYLLKFAKDDTALWRVYQAMKDNPMFVLTPQVLLQYMNER